jgi:4-hydroxy-tetrahydrodipicolinate synthase
MKFEGSMVAIVTPFRGGRLDEEAFKNLIEWHIESGTDVIVPCGTTGESATLSHEEHDRVIEMAVEYVNGRVPVMAGTGSNSTAEAIRLTKHAKEAGADGALLITPYYNKPTQQGLYEHYEAIARAVEFPMVLYNVPGRTGINMLPETVARLSKIDVIVGVKEATGSLRQVSEIIALSEDDFAVISGDDFINFPLLAVGGKGMISVTANVVPADLAALFDAWKAGDIMKAREFHYKTLPLHKAMFYETNPIPVKTALAKMGRIALDFRLPLCPLSEANDKKLETALKDYGLLEN